MSRASHLRIKYGITEEDYEHLLQLQDGKCGICHKDAGSFPIRLAVDHDHISGRIRGLLCSYCNHRLLGRHRDSSILRRMAEYLDRNPVSWVVPPKRPKTKKSKRIRPKKEI